MPIGNASQGLRTPMRRLGDDSHLGRVVPGVDNGGFLHLLPEFPPVRSSHDENLTEEGRHLKKKVPDTFMSTPLCRSERREESRGGLVVPRWRSFAALRMTRLGVGPIPFTIHRNVISPDYS